MNVWGKGGMEKLLTLIANPPVMSLKLYQVWNIFAKTTHKNYWFVGRSSEAN